MTFLGHTATAGDDGSDKEARITSESIVEHSARAIDNKVFLNWKITGLTRDCLFFIQRSVNEDDYETLKVKKGIGGDVSLTVLYCYIDDEQVEGVVKYRVKQIDFANPNDGTMATN